MIKKTAIAFLVIVSFGLQAMTESFNCLTPPSDTRVLEVELGKESIKSVIDVIEKLQLRGNEGFFVEVRKILKSIKNDGSVSSYREKINGFIETAEKKLKQLRQIKTSQLTSRQHEAADLIEQMLIEMEWAHYYIERILNESRILRLDTTGRKKSFESIKNTLSAHIHELRVVLVNNGFSLEAVYSMLERKNGSLDQAKAIIYAVADPQYQKEFQVMFALGYMFGTGELKNNLSGVLPAGAGLQTGSKKGKESLLAVVNARSLEKKKESKIDVLRQDINTAVNGVRSNHGILVKEVKSLMRATRKNLRKIRKGSIEGEAIAVLMGRIICDMRDCYNYLHKIKTSGNVENYVDQLTGLNVRIYSIVTDFRITLLGAGYPEMAAEAIMQRTIEDTAQVAQSILARAKPGNGDAAKFIAAAALKSVFSFDVEEFGPSSLNITRQIDNEDMAVMTSL